MEIHGLDPADLSWLRSIRRCDVPRQNMITALVLTIGIVLGMGLVALGVLLQEPVIFMAGASELIFAPIICAARYIILRLYRIIQTIASNNTSPGQL